MRILGITGKYSGVGYHRIMLPLVHMKKDYLLITDVLNDEILEKGFDIVVINRVYHDLSADQINELRNKYNFKLVIDNDDYWNLDFHHPLYERYLLTQLPERIKEYIRIADVCTTTHERLADEIYGLNKSVYILPNALPYGEEQFLDNKIESDSVRLFWSGSATHEHDIKIVSKPFQRLIGGKNKVIIAGYNEIEKPIWNKIAHYFSAGNKLDLKVYKHDEVHRYMAAYADSDISIIPLLDTKFNAMKSNLKVLETAAKKNPAIVSKVDPYLNLPVHYVEKQTDWFKHINQLTNDKQARIESGLKLFEYCNTYYNFKEINSRRFDIYSQLCL